MQVGQEAQAALGVRVGIGGWLALLVAILLVVGPATSFVRVYSSIAAIEADTPEVLRLSQWLGYKQGIWTVMFLSWSCSALTGLLLAFCRRAWVVPAAAIGFCVMGPLMSLGSAWLVPLTYFGRFDSGELLGAILASSMFAVIWTAYLYRSKRVEFTYIR